MEGGKSDKDMVDKHLYNYLDNFEKIYQEFNSSFPDLFCANESALRDLHENMEQKLDQVGAFAHKEAKPISNML